MKRRPRLAGAAALLASACLLPLAAGFAWFTARALRPPASLPHADGIVVLTGGAGRIDAGLRLLAVGVAPRLLISGVHPGTDPERLLREAGLDPARFARSIAFGARAISTRGNALETRAWARRFHVHRLVVVTAFYHMPRALAVLRRGVPHVALEPAPVPANDMPRLSAPRLAILLADEYVKYLAVRANLPSLWPDLRPAAPAPPPHTLAE